MRSTEWVWGHKYIHTSSCKDIVMTRFIIVICNRDGGGGNDEEDE